jgi:glycosyltransferase involved in cell wall biosynthesis
MIDSLVSVVIPCFRHATTLERAVRSVLRQAYLHEIIIVDDCSGDGSKAAAEALCELDPRIAVFSTPANCGPAGARNFGSMFATGHYLAFLDADDEYLDDFLKMTVEPLEGREDMRAIKTGVEYVDEAGNLLFKAGDPRVDALNFSLPSNMLIVAEAFRKIGGFPEYSEFRAEHGGEDVAFNQAVARFLAPLGRIDTVGYRYWNRSGSHLDRFIRNTVVDGEAFSFVSLTEAQQPGGTLDEAIERFLAEVEPRFADEARLRERELAAEVVPE